MSTYGPYRVVRRLGAGGMGEVFLAEHELIGRKAAIKVLHADRNTMRESVDRFFNEARAAAVISDPGIVQIYDFGFAPDGTAYIVMEHLEGESLAERLRRGPLAVADALRIVRQAAGSLAAAHAAGIVHRDLKPDNLFMVRDPEAAGGERPKILDFGIAKLEFDANRFKTRSGAVMGTPIYMSPEQCNDSAAVDHRADIYSLGCVLFHLLTGRPPFDYGGVAALISAHREEDPEPPSAVVPQLAPSIDRIVLACLAKRPADRFGSMLELQQECDAALRESRNQVPLAFAQTQLAPAVAPPAAHTTLGSASGQSIARAPRSSRNIVLGVAAAAVLVGVGLAVAIGRGGGEPRAAGQETMKPEPKAERVEAESKPESKTDPNGSKTESKTESNAESNTESNVGSKTDPNGSKAESNADPNAGTKTGSKADSNTESKTDTKTDSKADSKTESNAGAKSDPKADSDSKANPKAAPKSTPAKPVPNKPKPQKPRRIPTPNNDLYDDRN